MRIIVASDSEPMSVRLRELLISRGYDGSAVHLVSLDHTLDCAVKIRPQVIVLVLSPNPASGLEVLCEVQGTTPARVLAVGPASNPRLILQVLREGAFQYLDEHELDAELPVALRRVKTEPTEQGESGRIVTVLAASGGSGSSTVAVNIATALSATHERCALFDLKLQTGDLATLLDVQPIHTLADFCRKSARMDRCMFEQCFVRHSSGVHLLAPPGTYADVGVVTPQGVRKALSMSRAMFPYVVVDLDHSYRREQAQALYQADVILLVLQLDFTSLRQSRRTLGYIEQLGIGFNQVRLVVNRYGRPKELPVFRVEEALGIKAQHFIPDQPRSVNRANNNGVPVILERPTAKVSKSIVELAMSVNGLHATSK